MIKETDAMTAPKSAYPNGFLREPLGSASPDLLRAMVKTFADALMSAEADALCGAPCGQRSDERTNSRNGYRVREWDTRAGTVELAIPKLLTVKVRDGGRRVNVHGLIAVGVNGDGAGRRDSQG